MSVALAAGSVVGLLAERCTWQEPVDHGDAEQQGTIAILDKVNADLQESTPVALEQMLANTVDRMAAKDDRGAATIVLRWIASAAPEQLRELLETADFPEQLSRYRSAMRKTVLYRWAELEGEGDASRAWAVEKAEEGNQFAAWMPWLKSDREGALAKLRSEEHGDVLRAALNFLAATEEDFDLAGIIASGAEDLGAWVKIQMLRSVPVQQIIAAIEGIPDLDADQERSLVAGLVDGSELTPASLSLILNTVTDPDLKSLAIDQIATVVDNCPEVEQPLALLKLLVDRHDFTSADFRQSSNAGSGNLSLILQAVATQPAATAQWLAGQAPDVRDGFLAKIFPNSTSSRDNIEGRLAFYAALPVELRPKMINVKSHIDAQSRTAPRETFRWLTTIAPEVLLADTAEPSRDSTWLLQSLTTNAQWLARQDAGLAAQLVRDLPEGKMRDAMIQGAVEGVARQDLTAAIELATMLEGDAAKSAQVIAVRAFVANAGTEGARMALEAAADDPTLRAEIVKGAVVGSPGIAPSDQAALIDAYLNDNPGVIHSADQVALEWARDDPPAAITWMDQFRDRDGYDDCVEYVTTAWMQHDLASASAWLGTLPPGPARDAGVAELVEHVLDIDPTSALAWSATITNPGQRAQLLQESAQAVKRFAVQPDALSTELESLPVSEAERAALIGGMP
ncbi:MAG: hypothetical protein KDN22_23925 [Verrucomicrobiae bacterium]|nr:hypothetical protein [Verrucomicrobiae bacterium]